MTDPINKTGCVALYAARIHYYANAIVKTHRLEGRPGLDDQPWELPYQRLAAKIYPENLPHSYLRTLANVFAGCAQTMSAQPSPHDDLVEDWRIVHAYLTNASKAIADMLDTKIEPEWEDPTDKDPTTPNNVRFDILATYTTAHGATRLRDAGRSVADHLSSQKPITDEQIAILADLAGGSKIVDVAAEHGFSRRSLFREIVKICTQLAVENKQQAIALAVHNGWI